MKAPILLFTLMMLSTIGFAQQKQDSIFFDAGRTSLNWSALQFLNLLATQSTPNEKITINAVTIENDNMLASRRLSMRRAETAKAYLIVLGIAEKNIQIIEVLPDFYQNTEMELMDSFLEIRK